MNRLLTLVAGLAGAAGVALAAAGAHLAPGETLSAAALMLLVHASAFLALAQTRLRRPGMAAAASMIAGLALFAGDMALRAFLGVRLFPGAAPAGGLLMIAGWIGLALAALLPARRDQGDPVSSARTGARR